MAKTKKLTAAQRKKNGLPLYLSLSPQRVTPNEDGGKECWLHTKRELPVTQESKS